MQPQVQVNQPNVSLVAQQSVQQSVQVPVQQQVVQPVVQQSSTQNTVNTQPPSQSTASDINSSTHVLDMTGFQLPLIDQTDKFILKAVCPQIRKSII